MTANNDLTQSTPRPVRSAACFFDHHDECAVADCPCGCHHGEVTWTTGAEKLVAVQRAREDLNDGGPLTETDAPASPAEVRGILKAIDQDRRAASWTVIRAALADVLDAGDKRHGNTFHWVFLSDEAEDSTFTREKFIDEVAARIAQLQAPPHDMDARLLVAVARARKVLRRGGKR